MRLIDLKAGAAIALVLLGTTTQQGLAQQTPQQTTVQNPVPGAKSPTQAAPPQPVQNDTTGNPNLPQAPGAQAHRTPLPPPHPKDYTTLKAHSFRDPFAPYTPTTYDLPRLGNTPRLDDLLRDGKLYLSLNDAVTLAMENNYDIAIARINLDIADTDVLRTHAGAIFRGVSTGLVTGTLGGSSTTITGGGGPGGTSSASGGAGTGANGLVLSTNGGGPLPYNFDPVLTGTAEYERVTNQSASMIQPTTTNNRLYRQPRLSAGLQRPARCSTSASIMPTFRTAIPASFSALAKHPEHLAPRHRHPASAAGLWPQDQPALHHRGGKRPPHHRLRLPPADHLHGHPGRIHLLVASQRV